MSWRIPKRISSVIAKSVGPHVLRHSYATHAHASGVPARDLQEVLGPGKLETTMRYLRPAFGIRSLLDALAMEHEH